MGEGLGPEEQGSYQTNGTGDKGNSKLCSHHLSLVSII